MNINPDYQRDVVWSEPRMVHLIDSLFNNYYVPPLIFKVVSGLKPGTTERRRWRTCIDGKQRLTTIRKFFDGEIPYIDKKRQRWYYCNPPNVPFRTTKRLLSEDQKEFINNVQIVNIEFETLTEEQEEDMFQRVQLGVPLNVAEKLAALSGQMLTFINELRSAYTNIPSVMGTKRSIDFRLVTQLLYLMHQRLEEGEELKFSATPIPLKKFLEEKDRDRILTPSFRAHARRVFGKYNDLLSLHKEVFTHSFGTTSKMRRFSPVEFLGVGIMIDVYVDRPIRVLAEDVKSFREYLRHKFQDLRTNAATWIHVMTFINQLRDSRGHYPPENDSQAANQSHPNNSIPVSPKRNPAFNPPTPDHLTPIQPSTIYNERQQKIFQARLADRQQEQREAFNIVPPARPVSNMTSTARSGSRRGPDYAGGVQERRMNGATKRTHLGVPVKRER
jgi:hypothetical protein